MSESVEQAQRQGQRQDRDRDRDTKGSEKFQFLASECNETSHCRDRRRRSLFKFLAVQQGLKFLVVVRQWLATD